MRNIYPCIDMPSQRTESYAMVDDPLLAYSHGDGRRVKIFHGMMEDGRKLSWRVVIRYKSPTM